MAKEELDISLLEHLIGYTFSDKDLLTCALTHPSYSKEQGQIQHNQRLEFLGDAVLGLVLAESLFTDLPSDREGVLTRYRSMLVKGEQLSELARELSLGSFLKIGEAEAAQGGRDRSSILEDAFEAVVGAIYLDGGVEAVSCSMKKIYGPLATRVEAQITKHNPKGKLQEHFQPQLGNDAISYRLIETSGPDHLREFTVEVWVDGLCMGKGLGNSKKNAEEEAARVALSHIKAQ